MGDLLTHAQFELFPRRVSIMACLFDLPQLEFCLLFALFLPFKFFGSCFAVSKGILLFWFGVCSAHFTGILPLFACGLLRSSL